MCMFLSIFTRKSKNIFGLSLGIVMVSYVLLMISQLSDSVEFLKYFSVFTLSDVRNVVINTSINHFLIIISLCLSAAFIFLTIYYYNKKELV